MKPTKNDLIIYGMNGMEIYGLTAEQIVDLSLELIKNMNMNKLEEQIHEVILKLSGVGGPSFGADTVYIALDDQKRLELIHQLLYYFDIIKAKSKYIKKHLNDYDLDDICFDYLWNTKQLVDNIFEYGKYKKEDLETQIKQLYEVSSVLKTLAKYQPNIKLELIDLKEKYKDLLPEKISLDKAKKQDKLREYVDDTFTGLKYALQDVVDVLKEEKDNKRNG